MRCGDTLALNVDKLSPDFKSNFTCSTNLPFDEICDFENWRKEDHFMKVVRDSENYDMLQNKD